MFVLVYVFTESSEHNDHDECHEQLKIQVENSPCRFEVGSSC